MAKEENKDKGATVDPFATVASVDKSDVKGTGAGRPLDHVSSNLRRLLEESLKDGKVKVIKLSVDQKIDYARKLRTAGLKKNLTPIDPAYRYNSETGEFFFGPKQLFK